MSTRENCFACVSTCLSVSMTFSCCYCCCYGCSLPLLSRIRTKNQGPIKGELLLIWEIRTRSQMYAAGEHRFRSAGCQQLFFFFFFVVFCSISHSLRLQFWPSSTTMWLWNIPDLRLRLHLQYFIRVSGAVEPLQIWAFWGQFGVFGDQVFSADC